MEKYKLSLTLISDATFGRGDGVAGSVDAEVQHDESGLPFLNGRTLKGLLGAECADILYGLSQACKDQNAKWQRAGDRLFGKTGAGLEGGAILRIGQACLPDDLKQALLADIQNEEYTAADVLDTLTGLRRQTAMDEWGVPKENSLRTMRVILRGTVFWADLEFMEPPIEDDKALLSACIKAFRRVGTGRNRGRGRISAVIYDINGAPVTNIWFDQFRKAVLP